MYLRDILLSAQKDSDGVFFVDEFPLQGSGHLPTVALRGTDVQPVPGDASQMDD